MNTHNQYTAQSNSDQILDQGTPTPAVTVELDALYRRNTFIYIAVSENELQMLGDVDKRGVTPEATDVLVCRPLTVEWVNRMTAFRNTMLSGVQQNNKTIQDQRNQIQELNTRHEGLGEALLQEAIDRDWCYEYDEFADEWDLPKRTREYEVTITVRVRAQSEEDAEEMVQSEVGISGSEDWVTDTPYFTTMEQ